MQFKRKPKEIIQKQSFTLLFLNCNTSSYAVASALLVTFHDGIPNDAQGSQSKEEIQEKIQQVSICSPHIITLERISLLSFYYIFQNGRRDMVRTDFQHFRAREVSKT